MCVYIKKQLNLIRRCAFKTVTEFQREITNYGKRSLLDDTVEHSALVHQLKKKIASRRNCSRNNIYCHGPLLHTVQMSKIFEDSKTFVDMKMKQSPNKTMEYFQEFMKTHNNTPTRDEVKLFLNESFEKAGSEFEDWIPSDWKEYPNFIENIKDEEYKKFAFELNHVWKDLGRKMKAEIKDNQDLYSIIWVPNPVIVPGGRFREFYYWDSYWIVQGLLLSEMEDTVKGMLENFAYIVEEYGHIPNGGRIYYLQRSQPPLYIPMVKLYFDQTKNLDFIREHISTFDKEFNYWLTKHSRSIDLDGKNYTLLTYGDRSRGPRPESYSEDVDSANIFKHEHQKEEFYSELKAAAESGWDFSSRWFMHNTTNKGNLTHIKTRSIVPVDLNAIFYWNAVILAEWHELLDNKSEAEYYKEVAQKWLEAVEAVLWHDEVGSWLDYDLVNEVKRDYFFPSNLVPLWTGCYNKTNTQKIMRLVQKYLHNANVIYPGGIPTSKDHTGEQWDYPNAWPPLQHMMIVGLNNTGDPAAVELASELADKWVRSNYKAFSETEHMFEKYDATVLGGHGGGGEYEVQLGFGWSNGAVMDLMYRYGDKLEYETISKFSIDTPELQAYENAGSTNKIRQIMTGFIALIVTLAAGFIGMSIYRRRSHQQIKEEKPRPSRAKYTELRSMRRATSAR